MADYTPELKNAMSAIDQMIAQQQSMASQKPSGIFGNVDPAMLGLAQGFLSPTRTGSFGESVGAGLRGAEGPLSAMKKQQFDAQNKIMELQLAKAKLAMEAPYWQSRADYLSTKSNPNEHLGLIEADKWEAAANKLPLDDPRRAQYMQRAMELRAQFLPPASASPIADVPEAPETPGFFGNLWNKATSAASDLGKTIGAVSSNIGSSSGGSDRGDVTYDPSAGVPSEAVDQAQPKPAPAKGKQKAASAETEAPSEAAPESQFYTGDKPPKQFPQAQKAPDGKWYVVKDGKYHPVLK
jgi:hypothetical protein